MIKRMVQLDEDLYARLMSASLAARVAVGGMVSIKNVIDGVTKTFTDDQLVAAGVISRRLETDRRSSGVAENTRKRIAEAIQANSEAADLLSRIVENKKASGGK